MCYWKKYRQKKSSTKKDQICSCKTHLVPVLVFLANNVLLPLGLHTDGELFTNVKDEGTRVERGGKKRDEVREVVWRLHF